MSPQYEDWGNEPESSFNLWSVVGGILVGLSAAAAVIGITMFIAVSLTIN